MRAVVQRVSAARVVIDGRVVAEVGSGLLVLVGIARGDGQADLEYVAGKVRDLRIFVDATGRMNRSVADTGGAVLVVSQVTLAGDCRRGRRPAFDDAAPPEEAKPLYDAFVSALRALALPVQTGTFQATMQVELTNDGPVTMLLDSRRLF
jgi:D-tyrosyl-tRNA(Tyr) deacylase